LKFWAHQLINTHHKCLHVVFTGSFIWMNYMYNLWLGVHKFSRKLEALQKAWIQKSGINEIQNLKYKYSLGDVAHMI